MTDLRTYAVAPPHFHVSTFHPVWLEQPHPLIDEGTFTQHDTARSYAEVMHAQHKTAHVQIVPCEQTRCTVYIGN